MSGIGWDDYNDCPLYQFSGDELAERDKEVRAEVIEECIKTIVNTPTKVKIEHYRENDVLVDRQNEIIDMLERLKEQL